MTLSAPPLPERLGLFAALPKGFQAQGIVAFGQALPGGISHQSAVIKIWRSQVQSPVKEQLAHGGFQQISAAHYFSDLQRRVIYHTGELIRGHIVRSPDDKVAEIFASHEGLQAEVGVGKGDSFVVRNAKAPGNAS